MQIFYFTLKYAIQTHDKILEISYGKPGIRNLGLVESVIEFIKDDSYYPTFYDKLTHIVYSIAMNHAFDDGNKRSAIALGSFFLNINGYSKKVGTFILEMEDIIVLVASQKISKVLLSKIITDLVDYEEITENTKVEL